MKRRTLKKFYNRCVLFGVTPPKKEHFAVYPCHKRIPWKVYNYAKNHFEEIVDLVIKEFGEEVVFLKDEQQP